MGPNYVQCTNSEKVTGHAFALRDTDYGTLLQVTSSAVTNCKNRIHTIIEK